MPTELRPGVATALCFRLAVEGNTRMRFALEPLAAVIEKQAKINASVGSHAPHTQSPASPGTGPSVISGTLRRSITHSPVVFVGDGWETKVGTGVGFYPPYNGRKTSSAYGYILEVEGTRAGTRFPFLEPAFKFAVGVPALEIYKKVYGASWGMMI